MESIFNKYGWDVLAYTQLHQGLINNTFIVVTSQGEFIVQAVNHQIFKDPKAIDDNINHISSYFKKRYPDYLFTHLVPTSNGATLVEWEGKYYRAFHKIEGYALAALENEQQAYEAANQFGLFTSQLKGYNIGSLKITLPDFHNLLLRYQQFLNAIQNGNAARINESKEAIAFLQNQSKIATQYERFIGHKEVSLRVTHHDTKISNVLFKKEHNGLEKAICVIDLDTVMPGYFISDIGDMCRTCLCAVSEEEANLDLIQVDAKKWEAIQKGYMNHMQTELSNFEHDHLFFGGTFMIYMQALRFLTDYLNNDTYYGAKYEGQNYVRALNQIRLLEVYQKLA
jgi:Ser/Thr protein kinase RdoA (MazF antagonist)